MKTKLCSLLSLVLLASSAFATPSFAFDVFMSGEGSKFIKTDFVKDLGADSIRFAGCQVLSDGERVLCTDIGTVHRDQFAEMRDCTSSVIKLAAVGVTASSLSAFYTGVLTAATALTPGAEGVAVGLGAVTAGLGTASYFQIKAIVSATGKLRVYSLETEMGDDDITGMDYDSYIETLKSSFEQSKVKCNVAGDIATSSLKTYVTQLTDEEIRMLRRAKAN